MLKKLYIIIWLKLHGYCFKHKRFDNLLFEGCVQCYEDTCNKKTALAKKKIQHKMKMEQLYLGIKTQR